MNTTLKRTLGLILSAALIFGTQSAVLASPIQPDAQSSILQQFPEEPASSVTSELPLTEQPAIPLQPVETPLVQPLQSEEILHQTLISGSGHNRIAVVDKDGSTIWQLMNNGLWDEVNDADLLSNGNIVFAVRKTGQPSTVRLIRPDYAAKSGYGTLWTYEVPKGAENHTCQPIDNGGFLIGESYNSYIRAVELDKNGNVRKTIGSAEKKIEGFDGTGGSHGQIRQISKTKDGTYLAAHFSKPLTVEFDADGDTVAAYPMGGFTAIKVPNGNIVVSGGDSHKVAEFTPGNPGQEIWSLGQNDVEGFQLGFAAAIQRLPNGNTVIANWGGHGGAGGAPVAEITPDKKMVWRLMSGEGSSISNMQIIDDLNVDFTPDPDPGEVPDESSEYRSPADVASSIDTGLVYVADTTNKSIQIIRGSTDKLIGAIALDYKPTALLLSSNGDTLYVAAGGANGKILSIDTRSNTVTRTISVGHTPSALTLSADENILYVANRFSGTIQKITLGADALTGAEAAAPVKVTREPMGMERIGNKLYIAGHLPTGTAADEVVSSEVVIVNADTMEVEKTVKLANGSTNMKDLAVSPDGRYVYVTHALGRYIVATTHEDRGWIYTNAVSEIDVRTGELSATMLLDDLDLGAANPWGIVVTGDKLFITIAGTKELMIIDRNAMRKKIDGVVSGTLKVQGLLEDRDDIADDLTFLTEMKTRVNLGQEGPRGLAVMGGKVYVANYYSASVSVVNISTLVKKQIEFKTDAEDDDVRIGEKLWNDATIGFQQWQSCASCHPDARVDALNWDNLNDGIGTPKQARTMVDTFKRGRTMATGIRPNAKVAVRAGLKYIMFNATYPETSLEKIDSYVMSLKPEPSPYLINGKLSQSAENGKELFEGKAGCASCHAGEIKGSDRLIYNYTQSDNESRGLLVPPLREVWRTAPYLCDGSAATVEDVLTTRNPENTDGNKKHGRVDDLSIEELGNLVEYVLSISTEDDPTEPPEESYTVTFAVTPSDAVIEVRNLAGDVVAAETDATYSLANGSYTYLISKEGYVSKSNSFQVSNAPLTITETMQAQTGETFAVSFVLTPADAKAEVRNEANDVVSPEANGSYLLVNGNYSYIISKDGYVSKSGTFQVGGSPVTITESLNQSYKVTFDEIGVISGEIGTTFNVPVSVSSIPEITRSIESVISLPNGVKVADITYDKTLIVADNFEWNQDGTFVRFAFLNTQTADAIKLTPGANLLTMKFELTEAKSDGEQLDIFMKRFTAKNSEQSADCDVSGAVVAATVKNPEKIGISVRELYTGDGVDIIPETMKAVAVEFTGLTSTADITLDDKQFYYSIELTEKAGKSGSRTYIGLIATSVNCAALTPDDFIIADVNALELLFGDNTDKDGVNAQDALNVISAWLRKSTPTDKQILTMNVSADSRIDTTDAIAVVDFFVSSRPFEILSR